MAITLVYQLFSLVCFVVVAPSEIVSHLVGTRKALAHKQYKARAQLHL